MIQQKGFSLLEVLISLILFTGVSLVLLTQQQKLTQFLMQLNHRSNTIHSYEANKEYLLSGSHD